MKIYHYSDQGEFIAEGIADPDPMAPGSWLIPASATTEEPPKHINGKKRVFITNGWEFHDLPEAVQETEPPATIQETAPPALSQTDIRYSEIMLELSRIDEASARPARSIAYAIASGGAADPADVAQLGALEAQAQSLRAELRTIA